MEAKPLWTEEELLAEEEEWDDADLEMGFDPYEGCYSYDC